MNCKLVAGRQMGIMASNVEVDVCILTLGRFKAESIKKRIPVHKLIIETSSPLAVARMRAIEKVTTPWFAFIDDDVVIGPSWYSTILSQIEEDVGAVQGIMIETGFGKKWDEAIKKHVARRKSQLSIGQRGFTHNTLIRTKLVKEWCPSRPDLEAWEDYELTQHILKKGYRWICVPVDAYHVKSWMKIYKSAVRDTRNFKKVMPVEEQIKHMIRCIRDFISLFPKCLFDLFFSRSRLRLRVINMWMSISLIWGLLS